MCVILMLYGKEIIFSNLQIEERKIMAEGAGGYMEEINQRKIMVGCYYCAACGPHFACSERQWWDKVLDSEDWQRDSNFVVVGSKEGCCLTPLRFVDALAEIGRERSRAFI